MPVWSDLFKLWQYAFERDPLSKQTGSKDITGTGVSQPEAIPDIRQDGSFWGGGSKGMVRLRDTNDFIDLSTVSNRKSRYKEYERLRNVAEIEMAMTVFADEACLIGSSKISTVADGQVSIEWLTKNKKEPFLVYCWDFEKHDYTLGWAFNPRMVKVAKTIQIVLDDGHTFTCTPDHRILKKDEQWTMARELKFGDELMPFYKIRPHQELTKQKVGQFPRIYTFKDGWKHERQFIDEWKKGKKDEKYERVNRACKLLAGGLSVRETAKIMGHQWNSIESWIHREGFSIQELKWLGQKSDTRRIVGIHAGGEVPVYDLSVKDHENFCGQSVIFHNCQKGENSHIFEVKCENDEVKKELNFLFFNRKMLNMDRRMWSRAKNLFIMGDEFWELVIDPDSPKDGILKLQELPPDSVYRIETTKGKLIEFQQALEGPDYEVLTRAPVAQATEAALLQSKALRFVPEQIVHIKIGDDRKTFYPYGQSLIEPARGPAHQLRLMEDAMVVYRLCLVGDSRVRTINGWKYIKDVQKDDIVYSYTYNGKIVPTKVIYFKNNETQEVYKLRSKHIEIIGTATHPVLVRKQGIIQYVDLKDITNKDEVINVTKETSESKEIKTIFDEKWAKLDASQRTAFRNSIYENKSQLMRECVGVPYDRVKQFLYSEGKALPYEVAKEICDKFDLDYSKLIVTNKGQVNPDRINLPKYVDETFAKLFGFMYGDGFIRDNNWQFGISTEVGKDIDYVDLLEKYFGKVERHIDHRSKGINYVVSSSTGCHILKNLGYHGYAQTKRIPSWVFNASKEIRKAFVKGLIDADGHTRNLTSGLWTAEISLCNKELIEDVKELWHSIGLSSGHIRNRNRKGHVLGNHVLPTTTSYELYISEQPLEQYERVMCVKPFGKENVYDIGVENDEHNFVVNGTITHNTRAPERRVFYIDVGQLPPFKAEAFMERMKDQFKKKKVASRIGTSVSGASAVEERWYAPAADEDYWIPIRPNANTRIETLPGAQNLGEIDDCVYFRNKLFVSLNFPKNYFSNEDVQTTRIALSAQDVKFARMVERLQGYMEDGLTAVAERHLELRGFPEETYKDLLIKMTPPSDWREMSRAEVITNRNTNAASLKGAMLIPDYDILTKYLKFNEDETEEMLSRMKLQKLDDLKLQILAQNPQLLGVGIPGTGENEIGAEVGGPNPMLGPGGTQLPPEGPPPEGNEQQGNEAPPTGGGIPLPEPSTDDLKRFDLQIQTYSKEQDFEDIDYSTDF